MAEEKIYPYAVARVRVLEKGLLSKQTFVSMADAKSPEEALRILTEAGYAKQSVTDVRAFETLLKDALTETYTVIRSLVPEEKLVDVFLYKNDYHNMKVLLKEEVSGMQGEKYLLDGGTIPLSELKKSMRSHDYRLLPPIMEHAVREAHEVYEKTQNGQLIDIVLDKAVFISMKKAAEENGNPFILEYVTKTADLTNLKSFLRIKNMKKSFDMFASVFVPGGSLDTSIFQKAFQTESSVQVFRATSYGDICEEGMKQGFTVFEKMCDNYMMQFAKNAKFQALTLEPLVAYLYAKEMEIKTVRIIMTSKLNHIESDIIKERIRDAYV